MFTIQTWYWEVGRGSGPWEFVKNFGGEGRREGGRDVRSRRKRFMV